MGKRDARVDAYVTKSADFARPVLEYVRELVHETCPQCTETIKWGMPFFDYRGLFCHMASFKQHCSFSFWKGAAVTGEAVPEEKAMGQFGRLTRVEDLPSRAKLKTLIKKAMKLSEEGVPSPTRSAKPSKPPAKVPADLAAALKKNAKAASQFNEFSPSQRREYIEWIEEAKTEATRSKRLATTIEWVAEGKSRNWKYQK
jgi:uncharacterized protein YdeI (YjbR/CyaY-like superfamily)